MTITLQALSLVETVELVQVRFTLHLRDQRSMWMQDGCKVYMDSYMASNGSCFMVTCIILKNHLLEVGLTQNWETMATRNLTSVDLSYFIMCEDPYKLRFVDIAFGWGPSHIWFHTTLEVRDHTTWFWRCLGTSFGYFPLGSHNFMVTALGTCVKWPWVACQGGKPAVDHLVHLSIIFDSVSATTSLASWLRWHSQIFP